MAIDFDRLDEEDAQPGAAKDGIVLGTVHDQGTVIGSDDDAIAGDESDLYASRPTFIPWVHVLSITAYWAT